MVFGQFGRYVPKPSSGIFVYSFGCISTYITSQTNKQVDSVYNQYSIMMISTLILVEGDYNRMVVL